MDYIRGADRRQAILFPEVINDYIEKDNPVQFIDVFVESLNVKGLGFTKAETKPTGRPPYDPRDLLKLYIYGYLNRIRSSRRLERECKRNIELIWLLRKLAPDFKTIADFRKDNTRAIKEVCRQFISLCKRLDLFGSELVAIDGSKFRAVNSKKRNFNSDKLKRRIKEIEKKIDEYLMDLEENDQRESHIKSPPAEEIRVKIDDLKRRIRKYQELMERLKGSKDTQISPQTLIVGPW